LAVDDLLRCDGDAPGLIEIAAVAGRQHESARDRVQDADEREAGTGRAVLDALDVDGRPDGLEDGGHAAPGDAGELRGIDHRRVATGQADADAAERGGARVDGQHGHAESARGEVALRGCRCGGKSREQRERADRTDHVHGDWSSRATVKMMRRPGSSANVPKPNVRDGPASSSAMCDGTNVCAESGGWNAARRKSVAGSSTIGAPGALKP